MEMNIIAISNVRGFVDNEDKVWLNAEDVCKGFGFTTVATSGNEVVRWKRVNSYLKEYGFPTEANKDTFIPENMVYLLGFRAKNETAKNFQMKLANEVLPSIRKTGGYISTNPAMTDEEIMAKALLVAQSTIQRRDEKIRELSDKVAHDAPKVAFCDAVTSSRGSILIGELAKQITQNGVEIGQNRLFRWMRHNGFLGQSGMNFNIPLQRYVQQGLFELKTTVHTEGTDLVRAVTPMVTTKGQAYFINGFLSGRFSPAPAGGR